MWIRGSWGCESSSSGAAGSRSGCSLSTLATLPEEGHRVHVDGPLRSDIDAIEERRRPVPAKDDLRAVASGAFRGEGRRGSEDLRVAPCLRA